MPLIRQLWLLLIGTVLAGVIGSAFVTLGAARGYLETALRLKNSDNAQALALTLSQKGGDPTLAELLISAQFDTGFYERIRLTSPDGRVLVDRSTTPPEADVRRWFARLVPIVSTPGIAQVSDGWKPLGTLEVVSAASFAHADLWRGSLRSAGWLMLIGAVSGVLGSMVVRRINDPLQASVAQAQALVERRFVTVPEPRVPELRQLVAAMNAMVHRLQSIFTEQGRQLESLRQQAQVDAVTGVADRGHFIARLASLLARSGAAPHGSLMLVRVRGLADLNREHGHQAVDALLKTLAQHLEASVAGEAEALVGRLNGSDLALVRAGSPELLRSRASETFRALQDAARGLAGTRLAVGVVAWEAGGPVATLMREVDAALAQAESLDTQTSDDHALHIDVPRTERAVAEAGEGDWSRRLTQALVSGRAQLGAYPVRSRTGELLHYESPLRLQLESEGPYEPAARWLPWAMRSQLMGDADLAAVTLALELIGHDGRARGVNIAASSLSSSHFIVALRARLQQARPEAVRLLMLEVGERAALEHLPLVGELARQCRPLGVKVGLEHAGERVSRIDRLYEASLDFIKLDKSLSLGVATDAKRAEFLRGLVWMLHGLGIQVIAEGVVNEADSQALWHCGIDGQTGPWISQQHPA